MALLIALFTDKSSQADLLAAHDIGLRHAEYMAGTISGRANERAKQNKNLANGRLEGQKSQKEYAAETWRLVAERHKQFLKRPDYAGWKPGARATYLAGLMQADPDNNEPLKGRHQTNGQPYKASGIQKRLAKMG
jgi:hypothetical protein